MDLNIKKNKKLFEKQLKKLESFKQVAKNHGIDSYGALYIPNHETFITSGLHEVDDKAQSLCLYKLTAQFLDQPNLQPFQNPTSTLNHRVINLGTKCNQHDNNINQIKNDPNVNQIHHNNTSIVENSQDHKGGCNIKGTDRVVTEGQRVEDADKRDRTNTIKPAKIRFKFGESMNSISENEARLPHGNFFLDLFICINKILKLFDQYICFNGNLLEFDLIIYVYYWRV